MARADEPAREHYTAELRSRPGGTTSRRARWLGTFVSGLLDGLVPAPSMQDLVVIDRHDGTEVLRTPAGEVDSASHLLAHTEERLRTLTVAEFEDAWGIDQPNGRADPTADATG